MARFRVKFAPYNTHRWVTEVEVDDPKVVGYTAGIKKYIAVELKQAAQWVAYDQLRFDVGHDNAKDYQCLSVELLDDEACIE